MDTQERKVKLPTITRTGVFKPETINEEERTVEIVWTTGARVRRGFFTTYYEELSLEKKSVRMERLLSGTAPFLDNHGMTEKRGVRQQLGVIQSAKLVPNEEGKAVVRFSKRADAEEIWQDVKDGIMQNVSVGYNVYRYEKTEETDGVAVYRATDWEPVEVSLVPAGADAEAHVRSQNQDLATDCVFFDPEAQRNEPGQNDNPSKNENETIANPQKTGDTEPTRSTGDTSMTKEQQAEQEQLKKEAAEKARAEEKQRQNDIRSIVKKVRLEDTLADKYIEEDKSVEEVRELVIEALAAKDKTDDTNTRSANTSASVGEDHARTGRIEGMTSAILHRYRPQAQETRNENGQKLIMPGFELVDAGRQFAFRRLPELARICVEAMGIRTEGMPEHRIVDIALNNIRQGQLSTSDFPEILANVANKTLRSGYQAAPQTFMPFTTEVFMPDFKEISRTNLGDAPKLEKVLEGGEIQQGAMSENAEKYRVEEYAKIVSISRKVIVNDDLAAFTRVPERMGRRAADLESDVVWDVVKLNANMSDGNALYSAAHGNLSTSPGAPSETGLNEARAAMRRQTGLDGAEISLIPAWTFVPPAHETAMEKLLAATRPNNASDVNPFGPQGRTTLRMDVEPRLETGASGSLTAWFVMADKGQVDMVELARLEGTNGPQIQTREGFEISGVQVKIMHDVAAKAIDHVGMFKNAGA